MNNKSILLASYIITVMVCCLILLYYVTGVTIEWVWAFYIAPIIGIVIGFYVDPTYINSILGCGPQDEKASGDTK